MDGDYLFDSADTEAYVEQNGDVTVHEVTKEMADAVQVYLDAVRSACPDRNQGNFFIEKEFYCPSIHKFFYGKSDTVFIDFPNRVLRIFDYKHGAGMPVEVEDNPQNKYYGVGALEDLDLWDKVDTVEMYIVQPRYKHFHGPVRSWSIGVAELEDWLEDELVPAMNRAIAGSDKMSSGEHCRFCDVRFYACPQIQKDLDELEKLMKIVDKEDDAKKLTNAQVGRMLDLNEVAKIAIKAAQTTAFRRLSAGQKIPGRKLVHTKSNRAWKDGAEKALKKEFGSKAYAPDKLKSPAVVEKMAGGKAMAVRWSAKTAGPLSVAPADDNRREVSRDTKSMFKPVKKGKK